MRETGWRRMTIENVSFKKATVMVVTALMASTVFGDVLDPYDGIAGPPESGALVLYGAYWDYPVYADETGGDIDVDASIAGIALKGGLFSRKDRGEV